MGKGKVSKVVVMRIQIAYQKELKELDKIYSIPYEDKQIKNMKFGNIEITESLYAQADFILFGGSTIVAINNREEIRVLKKGIERGELKKFPAICLKKTRNGLRIQDGYHRIMAFYEMGIKTHKAIIVKGE